MATQRTRILSLGLVLALGLTAVIVLAGTEARERPSMDAPVMMAAELGRGAVHLAQEPVVITPQREREIGLEFLKEVPVETDSSAELTYVREVFATVATALHGDDYDYEVHLVAWDEPNAFALPGGFLVVTRGLLKLLRYEAELAFVIGHEINHVHRGHWRDALKGRVLAEKIGIGDLQILARIVYQVIEAGFSESQELEADRGGLELAVAAGYAPRAAQVAFRRFEGDEPKPSKGGSRDPVRLTADLIISAARRYAESHPPAAQRIENAEQTIRDHQGTWARGSYYWGRGNFQQLTPKSKSRDPREVAGPDVVLPP